MRAFASKFPQVAPEEILQMATVNPACALRMNAGRIAAGVAADLIAVPFTGGNIFEEIVAFRGEVDRPPLRP
jgi:imidazolonepropionase-like amidohydrolase